MGSSSGQALLTWDTYQGNSAFLHISTMNTLIIIAALVSCGYAALSKQQTVYPAFCYDPNQSRYLYEKCYSDQGLKLHTPQDPNNPDHIIASNIKNGLESTPENVCNNTDKYNAAIACSLNLTKACTAPEFMALLPDPNNLQTIQNIMCANLAQLNHLCTVNKTAELFKCSQDKYGTMTVADAYDPYISTCTSYDHAEECLEEEIQECGQANLDLQKQFNQLQKPPACMTTTTSPIGK